MNAGEENTVSRIDEIDNETLARIGHSEHVLRDELARVEALIQRHVLIGSDLSYWHERARIIRRLLHENSRAA
jgi:hypothetical protein